VQNPLDEWKKEVGLLRGMVIGKLFYKMNINYKQPPSESQYFILFGMLLTCWLELQLLQYPIK